MAMEEMDIAVDPRDKYSALQVIALVVITIHLIWIVGSTLIFCFRFCAAWNSISFEMRRRPPIPISNPPPVTFSYRTKLRKHVHVECPICLTEFSDGDKVSHGSMCHHIFHSQCLEGWMKKSMMDPSCPCCRQNILETASFAGDEDSVMASSSESCWYRLTDYVKSGFRNVVG